ncbi:helix-turn-helix domain-containing protein [Marinirhabdus gelatinilytica]|uniref:Helix-turn-helix protein n=1 Tax=Marinirhabdus gelatinilytica TaxID=1703343 RepID=A0A370Q8D8_9FLAO|nr:helix-turn-helix transcriptional regulator [Marinirhabdus gelatinilytica]RDK84638.1 helix-turn-helix protein [Marinirhabdus gelatinilytica]
MKNQVHIDFLVAFGKHLKKVRKQHNISRVQLAYEIGTHEKQLRLIEKGEINTGILSIHKIATVLDLEPKALLDFRYPDTT